MRRCSRLLCWYSSLVFAWSCGAAGSTAANGDDAAAPVTDAADAAGLDATADLVQGPVDAASDATAAVAADAGDSAAGDGQEGENAYTQWCLQYAAAFCKASEEDCCDEPDTDCVEFLGGICDETWTGKWSDLAIAGAAGAIVLDPALAVTCTTAIAELGTYCNNVSVQRAIHACMYAWTDLAAIGADCAVLSPLTCAGGKGRCAERVKGKTWTCYEAQGIGANCTGVYWGPAPCGLEGRCMGASPTSNQCFGPGTKCIDAEYDYLLTTCLPDQVCIDSTCVPDPGKGRGSACAKDADCGVDLVCVGGKCRPFQCD